MEIDLNESTGKWLFHQTDIEIADRRIGYCQMLHSKSSQKMWMIHLTKALPCNAEDGPIRVDSPSMSGCSVPLFPGGIDCVMLSHQLQVSDIRKDND